MTNTNSDAVPHPFLSPLADPQLKGRIMQVLHRMFDGESSRDAEEETRPTALPPQRLITLKMPTDMIDRLDEIAKEGGTNRSQLIRQIAGEFLNYVWAKGTKFRPYRTRAADARWASA